MNWSILLSDVTYNPRDIRFYQIIMTLRDVGSHRRWCFARHKQGILVGLLALFSSDFSTPRPLLGTYISTARTSRPDPLDVRTQSLALRTNQIEEHVNFWTSAKMTYTLSTRRSTSPATTCSGF